MPTWLAQYTFTDSSGGVQRGMAYVKGRTMDLARKVLIERFGEQGFTITEATLGSKRNLYEAHCSGVNQDKMTIRDSSIFFAKDENEAANSKGGAAVDELVQKHQFSSGHYWIKKPAGFLRREKLIIEGNIGDG